MPNDPRVKFHKGGKICRNDLAYLKMHPECYGFITDHGLRSGGGSGAGGGGGVTPGPTPIVPPGPGPGPGPPGPGPGPGPGPQPIPSPDKPGLNPGEIAGITIASVAAAAAAVEASRRAAEELERRRAAARLARAAPSAQDGIEMNRPRVVPRGFASVGSSPSSSREGSRSGSRSGSGTTTPESGGGGAIPRGVPTPFEQAGFRGRAVLTPGIDLLNPTAPGRVPLLPPDRMINPAAQGTPAQQMAELTRRLNPTTPRRQPSDLGAQVVDTQNELDISVRMAQMDAAGATDAEKLAEATKMREEYNAYLEELSAANEFPELAIEERIENPLTSKSEIAKLKQEYKKITGKDYKSPEQRFAEQEARLGGQTTRARATPAVEMTSAADRAGPRGIPRGLNPPPPVGNNPANDALNASQSTRQAQTQDPAARAATTASTANTITADQPSDIRVVGSIQAADPRVPKSSSLTSIELNTPRPSLRQRALERATAFIDRNNPFASRAQIVPTEPQSFELTGGRRYRDALDEAILDSMEDLFDPSARTIEDSLALDRANAERMERIRAAKGTPLQPQETASGAAPRTPIQPSDRAALGPAPAPPPAPPAQVETSLKPKYPKPAPYKEKAPPMSTDAERLTMARKALQQINEDIKNKGGFKDIFGNRVVKTPQEIESLKRTRANVEKMITELEAKVGPSSRPAKGTPLQPRETASGAAPRTARQQEQMDLDRAIAESLDPRYSTIEERQAAARRPVPPLAEIDDGAGLGIGAGREAIGMTNEEFANTLEQASRRAEAGSSFPLDPRKSDALDRTRQMYEYMRESDAAAARQAPVERTGPLSDEAYRQQLEGLPEDEIRDMMRAQEQLNELQTGTPAPVEPGPERPTPERPTPTAPIEAEPEPPPRSAPVERPAARPAAAASSSAAAVEQIPAEIQDFLKFYNNLIEAHTSRGGTIPEVPERFINGFKEGNIELGTRAYIANKILKSPEASNLKIFDSRGRKIDATAADLRQEILNRYKAARDAAAFEEGLSLEAKIATQEGPHSNPSTQELVNKAIETTTTQKSKQQRKLTRKGDASAAIEAQTTPAAARAARPSDVRAATGAASAPAEARAPRAAPAARPAPAAAEMPAAAPALTAAEARAAPSIRERMSVFEPSRGRPVLPPTEPPGPSPPTSAPESEVATPREGAITERTPQERAAFSEQVSAGLSKKPSRQKAKINYGKVDKTTRNPLDRFVSGQFRNAPNMELHPGARNLRGALSELSSRVPRLVPTRQSLISAGHNIAAEGGGAVAGFFAGSYAGQKMNEYFLTHPPKNRGDEFGQALATSMVALGVGNLVSKVVTYVIKQGARVAIGAAITGSIDSAATAGGTAILEAALFATVATTAQYFTTKSLEDAGYSHEYSRTQGSLAATTALMDLEVAAWLLKGGPLNLYADASFIVSELFIIGFGIWSYFEEAKEGAEEDRLEAEQRAEREQQIKERNESIARINKTNESRAAFMIALETHDYDFDALYATLSEQEKIELGISTPEGKSSFQRQVESAFDPFGMFEEPSTGLVTQPTLSPIELQRREVFNSYINYFLAELRGENPPPFNFDDPKVKELNEYSGGTWESAARVSATTSHMQSARINPLIENAQTQIIDAFHNERKTIEEMPDDVVRYAMLDENFRNSYESYIVADAQAQILLEFNNRQFTYEDMDPKLVEIAMRDPTFKAAADAYYHTLANQARDLGLSISEVAHLNSLMETDQAVEIGKLNEARNKIIAKNQAENQAAIDAYNASIVREINIYGDNFESIIRNINDQALVTGHTFLYATNRADLYRQLHMEMPELELVDPGDEVDQPDATWHPAKGRKLGDTAIYGFRHKLTDEQNQELEDMIASGKISRQDEVYQAALIRERDRHLYVQTDQERADDLGMSLDDYHAKFGITIDVYDMEIVDYKLNTKLPENGRIRMPDGSIHTYRDGEVVNILAAPAPTTVAYDPALAQQPDGDITMPDGSVRTYKNGLVTSVLYSVLTPEAERLSPDEINAQAQAGTGTTGTGTGTTTTPVSNVLFTGEREMPDGTTRSYKDGKVIGITYPAGVSPKNMLDAKAIKALNNSEGLYYDPNPPTPVTPVTSTEPLKNGIVNMPDGSIRTYHNGLVVYVEYSGKIGKIPKQINEEEGVRNDTYTGRETSTTTPEPVAPTTELQQGYVKMPDGSKRMYIDGKVVSVAYPEGVTGPTIHEINAAEGTKSASTIKPPLEAVDDFFKGKTPKEPAVPVTPAPAPAPAPEPDVVLGNRLDSLMGRQAPAPAPA